jgi:hypothetical protein
MVSAEEIVNYPENRVRLFWHTSYIKNSAIAPLYGILRDVPLKLAHSMLYKS